MARMIWLAQVEQMERHAHAIQQQFNRIAEVGRLMKVLGAVKEVKFWMTLVQKDRLR